MGCNCGGKKTAGYEVRRPGQQSRTVSSQSAAEALVKGIPGASFTPKNKGASK